jgi:hypothetical protein
MTIWKKIPLKIWRFGRFSPWKILCIGWNHIFQVEIWRKFTSTRITGCQSGYH